MVPTPRSERTMSAEQRLMPRFHLLTRVDIAVAGGGDFYWGSVRNLSRTGVAVGLKDKFVRNERGTIRFHFQRLDCRGVIEELNGKGSLECGVKTEVGI